MESFACAPPNEHDALYVALGTTREEFDNMPTDEHAYHLEACLRHTCTSPTERRAATSQDIKQKRKAQEAFDILIDPQTRCKHMAEVQEALRKEEREKEVKSLMRKQVMIFNKGQRLHSQMMDMHFEQIQQNQKQVQRQMQQNVKRARHEMEKKFKDEAKQQAKQQAKNNEKQLKEDTKHQKEINEIQQFSKDCPFQPGDTLVFGHGADSMRIGLRATILQILPRKKKVSVKVEKTKKDGTLKRVCINEVTLSEFMGAVTSFGEVIE